MSPTGATSLASLDGDIMPVGEAMIPATDDGLIRGDGVFDCPGQDPLAEILHHRGQRLGPSAVGDHDLSAGTERDPGHHLTDVTCADDPDAFDVCWLHQVPFWNSKANR